MVSVTSIGTKISMEQEESFMQAILETLFDIVYLVTVITIGVIMIDLNQLKYVNDTQGHAMGDRMILNFANILRNTVPPSNTICRWGGDEFTIMIMGASQEKMEQAADAIAEAVANYNATDELPKIHYACGWALSSEFPGLSPSELLVEADKRMYLDKRRWYEANAGKK